MLKVRRFIVLFCVTAIVMGMTGTLWAAEKTDINAEKIDINKATVKELTQLKKIGPTIAARIVEHREKNGPFKTPEDIKKIKGIGDKTFELNKDRIVAIQLDKKTSKKKEAPKSKKPKTGEAPKSKDKK